MRESALGSVFIFQKRGIGLDNYKSKESLSRVEENQNRMENKKGDNSYEKNGNAFNFDFRCNIYRMRQ